MHRLLLLLASLFCAVSVCAQDTDFFTDPSLLQPWDDTPFELRYLHPDMEKIGPRYNAVMVDQPEIHIAADSRYRGAKGDHLKQLADAGRMAMVDRIESGGDWKVVDEPGPDVVYFKWAISELYLKKKKKKRGILSYTPVGMVVHATSQAAVRDLWEKMDIVELDLMVEFSDSLTGEVLSAGVTHEGQKKELVSWQQLNALFQTIGEQTRCRLDNNKLADSDKRDDCVSIEVEPVM